MIIITYYKRDEQKTFIKSIHVTDWTNNDRVSSDYYENEKIKDSIYILKLRILIETFGDIYTGEIINNQSQYEQDFERFFEYSLQLVPDSLHAVISQQRFFNMSITG